MPRRTSGETAWACPELVFAPSGPSWPGGLRCGRLPAGRAGCSATGRRRCGPHRPTGAAPGYSGRTGLLGFCEGEPGPVEPAWLASGGPGGPRARKLERAEAGCRGERPARRRGLAPSFARREPWSADGKGRNGASRTGEVPVRAAPAYWGLRGGARAGRAGVAGERRARRPESEKARESRGRMPRRTSGETAWAHPELVFRAERAILARRLTVRPASCRPGRLQRNRPTPVRAAPAY